MWTTILAFLADKLSKKAFSAAFNFLKKHWKIVLLVTVSTITLIYLFFLISGLQTEIEELKEKLTASEKKVETQALKLGACKGNLTIVEAREKTCNNSLELLSEFYVDLEKIDRRGCTEKVKIIETVRDMECPECVCPSGDRPCEIEQDTEEVSIQYNEIQKRLTGD